MNTKILYFLGGVAVGSAVTFLALRANMEARIDEEVENVRQAFQNAKVAQNANLGPSEANESDNYTESNQNEDEEAKKARKIAAENAQRKADLITSSNISNAQGYGKVVPPDTHAVSYNLFSKPPKAIDIHNGQDEGEDLEIRIEDPEEAIDTTPKKDIAKKPYIIMPDQFINEEPYFDKITLEYYEDGVLCDERTGEILTDIESAIGRESLNHFGEYEDDVVYVRNERISTDYEVIYQDRPFARMSEFDE